MKGRLSIGPFICSDFYSRQISSLKRFIARSQNKPGGTADRGEHRASPFVVGAGNANHPRRYSMTNRFMISVAAAALIAGTGFANAQGTGMNREAPSAGSTTQQSAPASERGLPSATPMNRDSASDSRGSDQGVKSTQSEEKAEAGQQEPARPRRHQGRPEGRKIGPGQQYQGRKVEGHELGDE